MTNRTGINMGMGMGTDTDTGMGTGTDTGTIITTNTRSKPKLQVLTTRAKWLCLKWAPSDSNACDRPRSP